MDLVIPRQDDEPDESLASFVKPPARAARRSTGWCSRWSAGIYTADPNELSLKATLPQFLAMEREHGSLILRGPAAAGRREDRSAERQASGARYGLFVTLADGMDTLPQAAGRGPAAAGSVRTGPPSAGSAATSRARPGWSSSSTARRSRPTR